MAGSDNVDQAQREIGNLKFMQISDKSFFRVFRLHEIHLGYSVLARLIFDHDEPLTKLGPAPDSQRRGRVAQNGCGELRPFLLTPRFSA